MGRTALTKMIGELVPAIPRALGSDPAPGAWHVVVCFDGGAAVFEVTPKPEPS
jgi:hypothetical protein